MTHHALQSNEHVVSPEQVTPTAPTAAEPMAPAYSAPQVFVIGTATGLVQASITGHLRDGHPNGWYVYNS